MLDAGSLNRHILIQSHSVTQDESGQPSATWDDLLTCWASIKAVTSKEVYAASGFASQVSHSIKIRYPAVSIRPGMRVQYGDRTFDIQAVSDPDESRVMQNLLCLELNDGQ